ncbi:uncharacterized protein LOC143281313 isoform X2 [Babylonia areolata]|uniref:uncharacterized protein LOC143281313 isoform X2 n=1 Tax=Babylonia areolata TaxID=304850 RepID=UPI003FD52613
MDDCNLEKLAIKPGKLSPGFNRNTTEYNAVVASNVDKLNIDPLTSDSGASYSISGSGGSKTVPLKEGEVTDIKIEVTAEDGTVKHYIIHAKRLSAKDASLSNLKVDKGTLDPDFTSDVTEYTCLLPCQVTSVKVTPVVPDPKGEALLNGAKPGEATSLCVGETRVEVQVTSPDGSNKKVYTLDLIRKPLPRYVKFVDPKKALEFECPISLSPLYRPITVKDSNPKHTYSAPFMDSVTRTSKVDLLNGQTLPSDWRIVDRELESKMSAELAVIPLTYGGASDPVKFGELAAQLEKCNVPPKIEDPKDKFSKAALSVNHTVESRKWEKQLQQVFDETDPGKLVTAGQKELEKYYASLPKTAQGFHQFSAGESPLDHLQDAVQCFATAIKFKAKDANLHFQLAMVLEEKYFAEDMFGLKKAEASEDVPSFNVQAKESSKEEEVLAICKLRNVDAGAPVAHQLKALDQEYHHLIDSGQGGKAEHVQSLYAWFSKKVSQEGAAAHKAEDAGNPLGQAYLKYLDAVALDESKSMYNFHVGRLLVVQGNYPEAVKQLEAALCWNSQHQLSRIYLGLALSLLKEGPGSRLKECVMYLLEGMEVLLTDLSKQAATPVENMRKQALYADNLVRPTNVHLLRGLIQLGRLISSSPDIKDTMSAQDIFHIAALLATQAMPDVYRGDVYRQMEWVLLDAHALLLEMLSVAGKDEELIAQRCERLSALIDNTTIPKNEQLLDLQERTSQKLVYIQPCNSHALYLLGSAQFNKYENSTPGEAATQMLQGARTSFEASIDLQGKAAEGSAPELITGQHWYQERQKKEEEEKKAKKATEAKAAAPAAAAKPAATTPARGGATRGGGATAGRGATHQAARGRGAHAATPPARGGAAAGRGAPAAKRGAATPAAAGRGGAAGKTAAAGGKTPAGANGADSKGTAAAPAGTTAPPEPAAEAETEPTKPKKPAPINPKTYHAYLGLARVYRALEDSKQAQKYFEEVTKLAPEVHDAYIESAEMLVKSDPLSAVDVYMKFPVSETPSFDDAYIFGEIIRILMKFEKYDDERLASSMITYGKILGLGVLDRYVKILEEKFKNKLLQKVYAGVNGKDVDDPDMQAFFKFKCWI